MLRLLDIFAEYPHFSITEAANMLGIVKRTAERYVSELQKEGLLIVFVKFCKNIFHGTDSI